MSEAINSVGFEQRVRDRAYALWESEGRPHGRDSEHWLTSEAAARAEFAPAAAPAKKAVKPKARAKAAPKRAAASLEMSAGA